MADLLSDVVRSVKLKGSSYYRAELRGDFGLTVSRRPHHVRFHLALRGEMLVAIPSAEPIPVRAGDVFLVTMGAPHTLMDAPDRSAVPLDDAKKLTGFRQGDVFRWGEGPEKISLVCGEFSGTTELFHPVFRSLPTLVHAPVGDRRGGSKLKDVLRLVDVETGDGDPGWLAVANRLSEIVMIQVLRAWISEHPDALGSLRAMRDPRIKLALEVMHSAPDVPWTVQDLAERARMSRTSFSQRFTELMGTSPMSYLTSWRMEVARSLLHTDALTLSEVAERVGYASQASFTKVFREVVGTTPGAYRSAATDMGS